MECESEKSKIISLDIEKLPSKQQRTFKKRKTLWISNNTHQILTNLELHTDVDIPEMLRRAIDEYLERHIETT